MQLNKKIALYSTALLWCAILPCFALPVHKNDDVTRMPETPNDNEYELSTAEKLGLHAKGLTEKMLSTEDIDNLLSEIETFFDLSKTNTSPLRYKRDSPDVRMQNMLSRYHRRNRRNHMLAVLLRNITGRKHG